MRVQIPAWPHFVKTSISGETHSSEVSGRRSGSSSCSGSEKAMALGSAADRETLRTCTAPDGLANASCAIARDGGQHKREETGCPGCAHLLIRTSKTSCSKQ